MRKKKEILNPIAPTGSVKFQYHLGYISSDTSGSVFRVKIKILKIALWYSSSVTVRSF